MAVTLPVLEQTCPACAGGKGFHNVYSDDEWEVCGGCNGSGLVPTDDGKAILKLFKHNFGMKLALVCDAE